MIVHHSRINESRPCKKAYHSLTRILILTCPLCRYAGGRHGGGGRVRRTNHRWARRFFSAYLSLRHMRTRIDSLSHSLIISFLPSFSLSFPLFLLSSHPLTFLPLSLSLLSFLLPVLCFSMFSASNFRSFVRLFVRQVASIRSTSSQIRPSRV
jgi:hypothetical protein